jgi:asparagine synthase (glutamine-hydrolysing)
VCGIIGYYGPSSRLKELGEALDRGLQNLSHRGPDDHGTWEDVRDAGALGLGHRRLSILDLSPSGHQPMVSANGRFSTVFNGEIYNFREIRAELAAHGVQFRSTSDTEVVLEAYALWGIAAVERFIGMFALAIWDRIEQRLLLIRDRVGVKPLYFFLHDGIFAFASELRGLQPFRSWPRDLDRGALGEFFQFGYIAGSRTIFQAVRVIEAGTWISYSTSEGLRTGRYWSLESAASKVDVPRDERAAKEHLAQLLESACAYRLVSDVPVGVFLSGGIDSSLVAAIIASRLGADTRTYTIGFAEPAYDESQWAKGVAAHLGTHHTSERLTMDEAERAVEGWGELFDEPFGDTSAIPTMLVARLARNQVKVALSADGGDELFGGYVNYSTIPNKIRALERVPPPLRRLIGHAMRSRGGAALAANILGMRSRGNFDKSEDRVRKLTETLLGGDNPAVFELAVSYTTPNQVQQLLGTPAASRPRLDASSASLEEAMMRWDFHHYLPGDILVKVDRMTMRVGLEGREPLLDHRLAEFAFACPLRFRMGSLGTKHLLRSVLYDLVPRHLIDRPKQGFGIPLASWMRTGRLNAYVRDLLSRDSLWGSGLVDPVALKRAVDGFLSGARVDPHRIWLFVAFEFWRRKWLQGHGA